MENAVQNIPKAQHPGIATPPTPVKKHVVYGRDISPQQTYVKNLGVDLIIPVIGREKVQVAGDVIKYSG